MNDDEQEQDNLIDEVRSTYDILDLSDQPSSSTPATLQHISRACSDTNLILNLSPSSVLNETIQSLDETRRTRSIFSARKCSPS